MEFLKTTLENSLPDLPGWTRRLCSLSITLPGAYPFAVACKFGWLWVGRHCKSSEPSGAAGFKPAKYFLNGMPAVPRDRLRVPHGRPNRPRFTKPFEARDDGRESTEQRTGIYIKDQLCWPISASSCIYETYDLAGYFDPMSLCRQLCRSS